MREPEPEAGPDNSDERHLHSKDGSRGEAEKTFDPTSIVFFADGVQHDYRGTVNR